MANITELQLQGDSTVHKLNDARITTTAVDTATHILTMATNNGEASIAPITSANLASVLGVGEPILVGTLEPVGQVKWVKVAQMFYLSSGGEGITQGITFMLAGGDDYVNTSSVGIYSFSHHGSGSIHVEYTNLQMAGVSADNRRLVGYVVDTANGCIDIYCKTHDWNSFVYVSEIHQGSEGNNRIIREPNYTTTEPAGIVYLTNDNVVSKDIPDFYKNYNDLSSLASALGVKGTDTFINVEAGETKTITFPSAGFYIVGNTGGSSPTTIISISQDNNDIVSMGSTNNLDINTDNGKQLVLIKSAGLDCSLKNNASFQREFFYRKILF